MTFLQPILLIGLPALLIPVIIHLLNKRRHRTKMWAATFFLVRATKRSRGRRRLKHFLILACRVLAAAALVFALSRPLAGGWVSWLGGNRPEVILVLFDRSATMDTAPSETSPSKRSNALERLAGAVQEFASGTRLVLMDSAGEAPVELSSAEALSDLPQTDSSQTATDMPALLESALGYLDTAQPGRAEIWIASDLQRSNWLPEDGRWQTIRSSYAKLDQQPPIRILGLTEKISGGHGLRLTGLWREADDLVLDLEILSGTEKANRLPLTLSINGESSTQEMLDITTGSLSLRKRIPLARDDAGGWGRLSLGPDLSPGDNTIWFCFAPPQPTTSVVVSEDPAGKILSLACAPPGFSDRKVTHLDPENAHTIDWKNTRLIVWQAQAPAGPIAAQLESFVEAGGSLLVLPPETTGENAPPLLGISWAGSEMAAEEERFEIIEWNDKDGVLNDFRNGQSLAMDRLYVIRRRVPSGEGTTLATYGDGVPAVMRVARGRGKAVFLSTLPDRRWSDLGSYNILLPVIDRMARASARFTTGSPTLECGEALPEPEANEPATWETVDTLAAGRAQPGIHAGVYRRGNTLVACNTPAAEFATPSLERDTLDALFAETRMRFFEERVSRERGLATEIWRSFAIAMLLFLFSEALLSLPPRRREAAEGEPQMP